jgi:hypothetical protein
MIQANELRIGNWLNSWRISGDWIPKQIESGKEIDFVFMQGDTIIYKPIPLTEQWLIDFGFVSNPYNDEYFLPNKLILDINKMRGRLEIHWKHVELKNVHQLQNLYFALTGKELINK